MEAKQYPISIHLVGVLQKEKTKFYKTSVLWSDESSVVIYRRFREFMKMHKQLKKAFPPANKLRKSDRIVPRFREGRVKQKSRGKAPTKSLVRLKYLQKYCNAVLSCDQRVTQSAELIQFLNPKDQDLQPDFAKNGIIIMPPEDELRSEGLHANAGEVTQPFITEAYTCVAPYDTKDSKNKPLKVAKGDKLDVVIKDKGGWWLVETEDRRMAWFPAPYLERTNDDNEDHEEIPEKGALYTAVKSYKATKTDEVTVTIGAVVEVLQKSENGWWLVRSSGKMGYIPTMILQPHRYPHIHNTSHHLDQRRHTSLLVPSSNLEQHSQLSLSQGSLLQHPPVRSSSPLLILPESRQRSASLEVLSEQPHAQPAANSTSAATDISTSPTSPSHPPPPVITVKMDGEDEERVLSRSQTEDSEDSFMSDSTDFSFSDDSSFNSSLNLSPTANDEWLRLSRTPPPGTSNTLSPTSGPGGRLISSVSDPTLYKSPKIPKVPPRPSAQEILSRCTSVTRKNAAKGALSPKLRSSADKVPV
ncbi:NADPH oxidase organizer 1a [Maylandia zebra]|uniref:NADPH oxidase organizer 1a n=1 Tax=Maylandia zebra TaxID=106582 RepID=UPI000329D2B2|nr:NADPH oxidase organizer 1 [Maylandia zebra]